MFVIVHNNSNVILGPMRWNKYRFENEIFDDLEVTCDIPLKNDEMEPYTVNDEIKILPIASTEPPTFNPKIERLEGPFWTFTDSLATSSYTVGDLPVEAIKNFLKEEAEAERWSKENSKVTVNVGGVDRQFSTDKLTRSTFHQYITLDLQNVNWKYKRDDWGVLTKTEIQSVFDAIMLYVKGCFEWEFAKIAEIDACTTHAELDAIVIKEPEAT